MDIKMKTMCSVTCWVCHLGKVTVMLLKDAAVTCLVVILRSEMRSFM